MHVFFQIPKLSLFCFKGTLVTSEANELVYDISVKVSEDEHLLITASTDCSIKLWLIPPGYLIKSIYNYSPVTAILRCFNTVFAGIMVSLCFVTLDIAMCLAVLFTESGVLCV